MGSIMATTANTESTKYYAKTLRVRKRSVWAGRSAHYRHIARLKEGISSNAEQNQQQQETHTR